MTATSASSADDGYKDSYLASRNRGNHMAKLAAFFDDIAEELGLESICSCISVGTGPGVIDTAFAARCMPALKSFVAVEKYRSNVYDLRWNLAERLPNVVSSIHEVTIQSWEGLPADGERFDVVTMIHVLYYLTVTERAELYRRCFEDWLGPDGCGIIMHVAGSGRQISSAEICRRMDTGYHYPTAEEIREELVSSGYEIEQEHEYSFQQNLSDPDELLLRWFNYFSNDEVHSVKLEKIRNIMSEVIPDGNSVVFARLMKVRRQKC